MNCQAYSSHRSYGHPGQCETRSPVKEFTWKGKKIKGLCNRHIRSAKANKLILITDPSLEINQLQGIYGIEAQVPEMSTLQVAKNRTFR